MKAIVICTTILLFIIIIKLDAVEIKRMEVIPLDQSSVILQRVERFSVTEDEMILIPDYKAGDIKIYNSKGKLERVWGRRGIGPNEYLTPKHCDYKNPYFLLMDWGKRKLFIYKRENKLEFKKVNELLIMALGYEIKFMDINRILISGSKLDEDGKGYELYFINPENKKSTMILRDFKKYGCSTENEYKNIYLSKIAPLSIIAYCDYFGNNIYYVWEGNLKILKINPGTKKIEYFGKQTKSYITPYTTPELINAYNNREADKYTDIVRKMSFVTGIFTDNDFVALTYSNFNKNSDGWETIIQFYKHNGEFMGEKKLNGAVNINRYASPFFCYVKESNILYFLSRTVDDDLDEINKIIKYKIIF
jgi:hypothetical protein